MKTIIEKFINKHNNGLFLLDLPTGFGKTWSILKILKQFLNGTSFQSVKKMFFITNLKTNLPYNELIEELNCEEREKCLLLKANYEDVITNWNKEKITQEEIWNSEEYRNLNSDIEILNSLISEKEKLINDGNNATFKDKAIKSFENKINTLTEPNFRKLIKKTFFDGKSSIDKKKFIKENKWLTSLYPVCQLENNDIKVVFMTTAKFFSPISLFYRMPFYMYNDNIIKNSVIFIDEFDASKQVVLNQIIENSLKINVDIINLFTNIHYVLQNLEFPLKLIEDDNQDYKKDDIIDGKIEADFDEEKHYTSKEIIDLNKEKFNEIYKRHNFEYLLKSYNFSDSKAFIFDDGISISVFNDKSKNFLSVIADQKSNHNKILATTSRDESRSFDNLLKDVLYCINYFSKGIKMLALNYFKKINHSGEKKLYKYSFEEALMTVLNAFNLNGKNREYIENILIDGTYTITNNERFTRKGFKFIEIEDSNYHDLQSVAHKYSFETTPENLIILMAEKARVIGVSATATLPTVIGNFDINYLKSILGENFYGIENYDKERLKQEFNKNQEIYKDIVIDVNLIDDLDCFYDRDKIKIIFNKLFKGDYLTKYLKIAEETEDPYYLLIIAKLAFLYNEIGTKNIYSFIAFLNKLPRKNDEKLRIDSIDEIFNDIAKCNGFDPFKWFIVNSESFENDMATAYKLLAKGEKCYIITTYKTIGSGKNIQYDITEYNGKNVKVVDKKRFQKDFDGIYLITPTNLTQMLNFNSDNKYHDLARYLYHQQSLLLANKITRNQYTVNIKSGFKKIFFNDNNHSYYNKNSDLCLHSTQLAVQAMGRICRCKNKNKEIHLYSDVELLNRIQKVEYELKDKLLNYEFLTYLNTKIKTKINSCLENFSKQNKKSYTEISTMAKTLRSSKWKVKEWENLRDYVLKNPTTDKIDDRYEKWYFKFDTPQRGYTYSKDSKFNLTNLVFDTRNGEKQVSMNECLLPTLLSIPCVDENFSKNNYAKIWKPGKYVMSESLFSQIYLGALGEVAGKAILESQLGWDCKPIEDYSFYEFFDYKVRNVYVDFKNWNRFYKNPETCIKSIKNKLKRVNGEKAIIINILKRGEHDVKYTIDDDIITIPYLIDTDKNDISEEMIAEIEKVII